MDDKSTTENKVTSSYVTSSHYSCNVEMTNDDNNTSDELTRTSTASSYSSSQLLNDDINCIDNNKFNDLDSSSPPETNGGRSYNEDDGTNNDQSSSSCCKESSKSSICKKSKDQKSDGEDQSAILTDGSPLLDSPFPKDRYSLSPKQQDHVFLPPISRIGSNSIHIAPKSSVKTISSAIPSFLTFTPPFTTSKNLSSQEVR
jgi:hypothetical protein